MMNRKRVGALLLCAGLALVLFVSVAFIAHEADHDCTGEDCPVCRILAVSIRLLRAAALALPALSALLLLAAPNAARGRRNGNANYIQGTPVSWKIRLND